MQYQGTNKRYEVEQETAPGRKQQRKQQDTDKGKEKSEIIYLDPKEHVRMSTFGVNNDGFGQYKKTIQISRETLRSGSPTINRLNNSKESDRNTSILHESNLNDSKANIPSFHHYNQFSNPNIIGYMQPFQEYSYIEGSGTLNHPNSRQPYNNQTQFNQNSYYQRRQNDSYIQEGPYMQQSYSINTLNMQPNFGSYEAKMGTHDSLGQDFRIDTHNPNVRLNMSNFQNQRSPNRDIPVETEEEQIHEIIEVEQEDIQEVRRRKISEIQYLKEYNSKDKKKFINITNSIKETDREKEENEENADKFYEIYGPQIEQISKNKDLKFFTKKQTFMFDKNKTEGKIVNKEEKTLTPGKWDFNLQSRSRVIKKVTKLSSIVNSRSQPPISSRRATDESEDDIDEIKKNIREAKSEPKRLVMSNAPRVKFMRLTLAMLSSKGHNCEDRLITRDMRYEKGGVVDLARKEEKDKNNKYIIKKLVGTRSPHGKERYRYSTRDREKAVKIVQAWWRELLKRYKTLFEGIVKIQSVWRSHFFRINMYDMLYFDHMVLTFENKIENIINNNNKQIVFDVLKENFGVKLAARNYLLVILKLQKKIKIWLEILRNKKNRMANVLEKIAFRRKEDILNTLKKVAEEGGRKEKERKQILERFLLITKRKIRVAIFHDFMFILFDRPVNHLKSAIIKQTFKGNFRKFHHLNLREYFMRWLKLCLGSGDYKKLAAEILYKSLMKIPFRAILKKLQKVPPKDFKERIVKGLVKNYDKDLKKLLDYYFKLWKTLALKLKNEDVVKTLNSKLLFKTAKKAQENQLRQKFRLWRDSAKSKSDLRPFLNGLPGLDNFVKKAVAKKCMDPLRSTSKGVQQRAAHNLILSNKFHKVPLRHYFNKWKAIVSRQRMLDMSAKFLKNMKDNGFKKLANRILLSKFLDWRRKVNLLKLADKHANDDTTTRKFYAIIKLMNGTEKLAKRAALKVTLPQIFAWLIELIKQRATKDLLFLFPKLGRITLRNYWRKWNKQNDKLRQKDLRNGFFGKLSTNTGSKLKLKYIRKYFLRWFRSLPKNMDLNYYKGADKLRSAVTRKNLPKAINALKEKVTLDNAKSSMQHAFGLKDKYIKRHWRQYLVKWRKIAEKIKVRESEVSFRTKIIFSFSESYIKKIKLKWWNHWKKTPKLNLNKIYEKFKNGADLVNKTVNKALQPARKNLLDNLKNSKSKPFMKNVINKLIAMATQGNSIKLRHYLWKWNVQCKNEEIFKLKKRIFQTSILNSKNRTERNEKYYFFSLWRSNVKGIKIRESSTKFVKIVQGLSHLENIKFKRENDFWIRLNRLMNNDFRGKIMADIKRKLCKPKYSIDYAFLVWKQKHLSLKANEKDKERMVKLLRAGTNKFKDRIERDNFIKIFHLWFRKSKIPSDYYQRILDGKKKVNDYLKDKLTKPYNQLKNAKNYQKLFLSALPANSRLAEKDKNKNLLRLWNIWKKVVHFKKLQEHKALFVGKLSDKHLAVRDTNSLMRYFRLWAGIKKKTLQYPDVVKGTDIINEVLKRPHRKNILDSLNCKKKTETKKKVLRSAVHRKKNNSSLGLKAYFLTWRTKSRKLTESQFRSKVIANNCQNYHKKLSKNSLAKAFYKWAGGKTLKVPVNNYRPARVACEILRRTMEKLPWLRFKKNTKMLNLKIPRDMSLSHALIRLNPDVCKSIALRNISIRKNWKLWKAYVKKQQTNENRDNIFSKIMNNSGANLHKTCLRRYLNLWKKKQNKEKEKEQKDKGIALWAKSVYSNNVRFFKKKYLRLWKLNYDKYIRDLANIALGARLLNAKCKRPHWNNFKKYGHYDPKKLPKVETAKKIFIGLFLRNIKSKVYWAFNLWRRSKDKEKCDNKVFRAVLPRLLDYGDENDKKNLKPWFLLWKATTKKNNFIEKSLFKLCKDDYSKLQIYFRLWKKKILAIKNKEAANKIQNFTRKQKDRVDAKKEVLTKTTESMSRFIKLWSFNNIWKFSRSARIKELLFKNIKDLPDEVKKDYLKKYLLKWWKLVRKEKEDKAATKINNNSRVLRSCKRKKTLENQVTSCDKLLKNLYIKWNNKLESCFHLWRKNTEKIIQKEKANIIQNFMRPKYDEFVKENARESIYRLVKKKYIANLKINLKRTNKVKGNRAQIMYDTLNTIYFKRPFLKLRKASKWIGIIGKMREIWPKISSNLKIFYLPSKLRLWNSNTVGALANANNVLNEWNKEKENLRSKNNLRAKNKFFEKYFQKLDNYSQIVLKLKLKQFSKNSKILKFNLLAEKIQSVQRGNIIRNKFKTEKARDFLNKLMTVFSIKKNIQDLIDVAGFCIPLRRNLRDTHQQLESRVANNNLANISNNEFRNKLIETLTGNKNCSSDRLTLRFWFNKWLSIGEKKVDSAKKIQGCFRIKKAKDKKNKIIEANECFSNKLLKLCKNDGQRTSIILRMWCARAQKLKIDQDAKIIKDFCRVALSKSKYKNTQSFFCDWSLKIFKFSFIYELKLWKFKWILRKVKIPKFIERLKNNDKYQKLKAILKSQIEDQDEKKRTKGLNKYIKLWKIKNDKLAEKEDEAAKKITNSLRGHNIKKKINNEKSKSKKVNMMLIRLCTRMIIKQQVALRKWKNWTEDQKQKDAANKIQDFCRNGQNKLNISKKKQRDILIEKFITITIEKVTTIDSKYGFKKFNEEIKREKLKKCIEIIENKKNSNLKDANKTIKKYADAKETAFKDFAHKVQRAWKNMKWRKHIWNLILRIQKLRKISKIAINRNYRVLFKSLRLWKKNMILPSLNQNATKIQNFCREKIFNPRLEKKPAAQEKIKKLIRFNFCKIKLVPVLKNVNNTKKITKLFHLITVYTFKKFRYNIDNREKINMMNKLFKIPETRVKKILLSKIKLWRINMKEKSSNNKKALRSAKPRKLNFKGDSIDQSKENENSEYKINNLTIPGGNKKLSKVLSNVLKNAFDKLKKNQKNDKLCKALPKFIKKLCPTKEDFNKLKNGMKDRASVPLAKEKIRKLFRFYFIKKVKDTVEDPLRLTKLRDLMRLCFIHKNINDKRTHRELIRKWRFHVMMTKFLKKKSEKIYKQMHVNYLNIVNDLIGEGKPDGFGNGTVYSETELLVKNMGLYKNVDINYKHETTEDFFFYQKLKETTMINEEDNNLDEDNPDMFADSKINFGRYGEDTIKSSQSRTTFKR